MGERHVRASVLAQALGEAAAKVTSCEGSSCSALVFTPVEASSFGKHIFSPSHCWPHQHTPSALMMQVPVPQHLGSSVIEILQGLTVGLAIGTTVVGNDVVIKLHVGATQRPVFRGSATHAHAPQTK
jgi:hypothetical protein